MVSAGLVLPLTVAGAAAQEPATPAEVVCGAAIARGPNGFADVATGLIHAPAIACAEARGWTVGRTPTTFAPGAPVTRAAAARFLARLVGQLEPAPTAEFQRFSDVTDPTDLVSSVGLLGGLGVFRGFEDGSFRPAEEVTRAQFASALERTLRVAGGLELPAATSPFTDVPAQPHGGAVGALHAAGIVAGVTPTTFRPADALRRDQVASLLVRAGAALVDAGRLAPLDGPVDPGPDAPVRLDQIQVLGSHNSYKQPSPVIDLIRTFDEVQASEIDYGHVPIPEQLERQGVRQLELDVFADPEGGRYAQPLGLTFVGQQLPPPVRAVMEEPGFKVLHAQDVDFASSCLTLLACLEQVRSWSDANPTHLPVVIHIEAKDASLPPVDFMGQTLEFTEPLPFTAEVLDALDADILSVFPADRVITPDQVRAEHATLEDAVLAGGWPALDDARGRVLFTFENRGEVRERYRADRPSLQGRVMFTTSEPGSPDAAFLQLPDPLSQEAAIADAVRAGYLVRTRSDTPTYEARSGSTERRDAALRSGAQLVSTDYADPSPFEGSDYQVVLPGGGPARCNPVLVVPTCDADALAE